MSECCSQHGALDAKLQKIEDKLDLVLTRLGAGDTSLAVLQIRVDECEDKISTLSRVLVWGVALVVGGVAAAVLKVVLV